MAKFNKDKFLNEVTSNIQSGINKGLISKSDIENDDLDRLHGFIKYELTKYIEDRKFALDVLSDFNYDDKIPWDKLQDVYGKFKTLMDIALVNLWKFLENEGATEYQYYKMPEDNDDELMLDAAHKDDDKFDDNKFFQNGDEDLERDMHRIYGDDESAPEPEDEEEQKHRIRFHHEDDED